MSQTVQVLERPQDIEVVDSLGELPLFHHGSNKDRRNLVAAGVVIFVPGHNQEAVVALRKLNIAVEVLLQPRVTLGDGAIVHVVIEIGYDKRERRQSCEVGGKTGKRLVGARGYIGEINPRTMLAGISSGRTNG